MERAPLPIAIWLLAIVTGLLAVPRTPTSQDYPVCPSTRMVQRIDPFADADRLYRAGEFARAAALLESYASYAEGVDFKTPATQYAQLARAWAIGMDPAARPSDALIALREATKLDLVLGGAHTDELIARERVVAQRAVDELIANGDREGAEAAQHVVDTLGP